MTRSQLTLDREARRLAQHEFDRPLLIEAGAGTGKTATLVNRVLAWCLDRGWLKASTKIEKHPADIFDRRQEDERVAALVLRGLVAITFTEAAASEMAERVLRGFQSVKQGEVPVGFAPAFTLEALHHERAGHLLACAEQLQIRTIHAFCRKILAENPFAAGLHPQFTVDGDGSRVREMVEEVIEASLSEAYDQPGDEDFLHLAERGHGPREIADLLEPLTASGIPIEALDARLCDPARFRSVLDRLGEVVDRLRTLLEVRRPDRGRAPNAHAILRGLGRLRQRLELFATRLPEVAEIHRWLDRHFPPNLMAHLTLWARGETANSTEQERLGPVLESLRPLAGEFRDLEKHLRQLDPPFFTSATHVLRKLLEKVRHEMRLRGVVCFADLLRAARDLLLQHPGVRSRLRNRLDQLLVDEFQDTDALQCDLIGTLALYDLGEQRPGLFVVGDPKQSIYGWRSADLEAYENFADSLLQAGGARYPLIENFRSAPEILQEVERAVAPVMVRKPGLQPAFHTLEPCENHRESAFCPEPGEPTSRPRSALEYWISWSQAADDPGQPAEPSAVQTARLEAYLLARDLLGLHRENNVGWSEIAILLRSFTDLEIYLSALRDAGIPFDVSRDRQYYRRREIIDANALVRAVLAPEDAVALLAFLRSSAVGVPDAALLHLWHEKLPQRLAHLTGPPEELVEALREIEILAERVAQNLPPGVPGLEQLDGWHCNLIHAVHALADLRHSFETLPADRFIDRLRALTLFEVSESTRYLGGHRLANLDRFFLELFHLLEASGGDRHRTLRRLRNLIRQGAEAEEARPGEAGDEAVRVLTIHQSKGLEFPHVYLMQTHKEAGRQHRSSFEIGQIGEQVEARFFGVPSYGFDRLESQRQKVARAELVRTLYVAMTRAEKRLVLAGRRPLSRKPPDLERATTHAALLLHRELGPSTEELREYWRSQHADVEHGAALWSLGGLDTRPIEPREVAVENTALSLEQLTAEQRELQMAQKEAKEIMNRPFRATASQGLEPETSDSAISDSAISDTAISTYATDESPAEDSLTENEQLSRKPSTDPEDETASQTEVNIATLSGRAVHRVLETLDLEADLENEHERQQSTLPALLRAMGSEQEAEAALPRAQRQLENLLSGRLVDLLRSLKNQIVARELPVLLPPSQQAVGYKSGIVDLVYRDETGQVVIVDFKTSSHFLPEELREKHLAQAHIYRQAVEQALVLDRPARVEIWYLGSDHVLRDLTQDENQF